MVGEVLPGGIMKAQWRVYGTLAVNVGPGSRRDSGAASLGWGFWLERAKGIEPS
jgi:hypothetical protein